MDFWEIILLILMISMCFYTIVDRICKTFEHVATAKAMGEAYKNSRFEGKKG